MRIPKYCSVFHNSTTSNDMTLSWKGNPTVNKSYRVIKKTSTCFHLPDCCVWIGHFEYSGWGWYFYGIYGAVQGIWVNFLSQTTLSKALSSKTQTEYCSFGIRRVNSCCDVDILSLPLKSFKINLMLVKLFFFFFFLGGGGGGGGGNANIIF